MIIVNLGVFMTSSSAGVPRRVTGIVGKGKYVVTEMFNSRWPWYRLLGPSGSGTYGLGESLISVAKQEVLLGWLAVGATSEHQSSRVRSLTSPPRHTGLH